MRVRHARAECAAIVLGLLVAGTASAQSRTYLVTDGDAQRLYRIQNGAVTGTFTTFSIGYPIAAAESIWIHDRDDLEAREYDLSGVPTGDTQAGTGQFSQLLDGATDGTFNYAVECCGAVNSVIRANLRWGNAMALFDLGFEGTGIAHDSANNRLFVVERAPSPGPSQATIHEFSITGNEIRSFLAPSGFTDFVGLAYDPSSDTLWGKHRTGNTLYQLNKVTGVVLDTVVVTGLAPANDFGGEFSLLSLFSDGFESGDASAWGAIVGGS